MRELRDTFAKWHTPASGHTVVVFAPHTDDETLATGGLIRQAVRNGAHVWVVLVTNGDGFRAAAMLDNRSLRINPKDFVEFGYRRQKETFAALKILGVPRDHIITLGYPDKGIEQMWLNNWMVPFVSLYTKDDHSPYSNSFTPHADYTGMQLLSDIEKTLRKINPDDIYMPHPNDQHSDHWATSVFVCTALYDLGWLDKKNIALYLVHRGDWPVPQGLHPQTGMVPPAKLADIGTDWRQYPLEPDTIKAKKLAMLEFSSQTAGTQRFIRSFLRKNELFGTCEVERSLPVSSSMVADGQVQDWEGIEPIIKDPIDDGMPAHTRPGADLTAIYAARDSRNLYFRITVRGKVTSSTIYELRIHPMKDKEEGTIVIKIRRGTQSSSGWKIGFGYHDIEMSCPINSIPPGPMLISASSKTEWYHITWYQIDRSAYKLITP
jgi:LmbE family N-acetylglucosaminyl deacetylase